MFVIKLEGKKYLNFNEFKRIYNTKLIEIDKNNRIAKYKDNEGKEFTKDFDIMHVGLAHKTSNFLKSRKGIKLRHTLKYSFFINK